MKGKITKLLAIALLVVFSGYTATVSTLSAEGDVAIGAAYCLTGALSDFGARFLTASNIAAENINGNGGLNGGGKFSYVIRDDATNAQQAVQVDTDLVNNAKVPAILGHCSSGATIPASAVTVPAKVVMISPSGTSPRITTLQDNDFVFRTAPSDALQGVVLAKALFDKGYRKLSIIYRNDAYGGGLAQVTSDNFKKLGGTVLALAAYEDGTTDFSGQITQATKDKPDAISIISFQEAEGLITQMVKAGATNFDGFTDGTKDQDLVNRLAKVIDPKLLENKIGTGPGSKPSAGFTEYTKLYKAKLPGEEPFIFSANAYDSAYLVALAALKVQQLGQPVNGENIRNQLRFVANPPGDVVTVNEWKKARDLILAGKDINYEGASGDVNFDNNGDVSGPVGVWSIKNGKISDDKLCDVDINQPDPNKAVSCK
ncbi:ABC transporter substrate-binding protein [Candidatus Acetothermia bacterium]|nr:ABC transporter substrate-binding protein [Candidatus Acetothermia bacterium]